MADVTQQATPTGSLAAWRVPLAKTGEAPASAAVDELARTDSEINTLADARALVRYTAAEKTKLADSEAGATADQTGSEIKASYEGEGDTNAFTDVLKGKLDAAEDAATADQTAADIVALLDALTGNSRLQGAAVRAIADAIDSELGSTAWRTGGGVGGQTSSQVQAAIDTAVAALRDSVPADRDTLNELNDAIVALESATAATGNTFRIGTGAPADTLGVDGDTYLDKDAGTFYLRASGAYTDEYTDLLGASGGLNQSQVDARVTARALLKANNLSGLTDAAAARTNLGINLALFATLTGASFTGAVVGIAPSAAAHLTRKDYVDDADVLKASLTGASFTGAVVGITPSAVTHLTRKDYVDDADALKASLTGASFTGAVVGITPSAVTHLTRKDYVDDADALKANLSGATFTGETRGLTPVNDTDFTTKAYVDSAVAGTTPPSVRSELIYYGQILAANAADLAAAITYAETIDVSTLDMEDATVAGHNITLGPSAVRDFFLILAPATHDLLTLVNLGTQGDERNTYSRSANARNDLGTPSEQYNSYVLGPLNPGVSISYRLTLVE